MTSTPRSCFVLVTLSSLFVFAACSDDADDGAGANVAGETGEAGTPSASGGRSHDSGGAPAGGAAHGDGALECEVLGELCHAADTGSGPASDCHDIGHVGDVDECTARFASCIGTCTETDVGAGGAGGASGMDPKCAALGSLCHDAGEIDAKAQECHELGHEGNAAACAQEFAACATLCLEVLEHSEAGAGGASGAGSGGAAAGGAGGAR